MKKKILTIIALVFCVALVFSGCATVSAVKDSLGQAISFNSPVYFGGQVAEVGDYIYYGNAYVATTSEGFKYSSAAKVAYLSRIENKNSFTFDEDVKNANIIYTTPQEVEKVKGKKLVGYENQNMYAYGQHLYFTSANVHKTRGMENDYSQISLFRIKFDGSGLKEIATFKSDASSDIKLVQGSDGQYYFVAVAPKDDAYAIYSVKVGKSVGKAEMLVDKVTSAVIADENSSQRNVIYTVDAEKDNKTTSMKAVDFATGEITDLDDGVAGSETKLISRVGDRVFYSYTNPENKIKEVYSRVINHVNTSFSPTQKFYDAESISDVEEAGEGFIFKTDSGALVFKTLNGVQKLLLASADYSDRLFVKNDFVYVSTDSSIKRVSVVDYAVETIVSGVEMISGKAGYSEGYLYFYAKLGTLELNEGEEATEDGNYYMYRSDMLGNIQLIGKTAKK